MFFTAVNPMEDDNGMGETPMRLDKAKDRSIENTRKLLQNTVYWCNFKLAQDMQSSSTTHCQPFALRKRYA